MLKDVKYFIIDMDGTFYLGDNMIDGAYEFTDALPGKGKDFYFFTNNSSHDANECLQKLIKIGYPVPEEKIIIFCLHFFKIFLNCSCIPFSKP